MKSPHLQLKEALFEINRIAYETDDHFKECEAKLENYINARNLFAPGLKLAADDPEQLKKMRKTLYEFDFIVERLKEELRIYLDAYLEENRVEVENPDEEKLDAAFALAHVAHERIYLVHKYKRPDLLPGFMESTLGALTPDEMDEFWRNVRRREIEELDEILASVEADATALRP
jgi:hypothetical protein